MAFDSAKRQRDRGAELNGSWMVYDNDTSFLVARKNNNLYKNFISEKYRENEKLITSKSNVEQANEISDRFMLEGMAKFLLKDWKGVLNNGVEIPYSWEVAMDILEEHDDLRDMIEEFSTTRENYIKQQELTDSENLKEL